MNWEYEKTLLGFKPVNKWTTERIQKFWERCRFRKEIIWDGLQNFDCWRDPYNNPCAPPDIHDLNAIFRYAVPRVIATNRWLGIFTVTYSTGVMYCCVITWEGKEIAQTENSELALALAEAIEKVLEATDE